MAPNSKLIILLNAIMMCIPSGSIDINDYDKVLASATACFNPSQNNESTIFPAPKNGTLAGVILTLHPDSTVPCPEDHMDMAWSCMDPYNPTEFTFHTIFSKVTDPTISNHIVPYYPLTH
eukprot:122441_1